jgi:hypothetical protein
VPVALNLYKIRQAKDAAGDFFRSVQKQAPNYQGLWIVTAEGKVLASHHDTKDLNDGKGRWARKVLADLEAGIRAFGSVKPRQLARGSGSAYEESLPHRGLGVQKDGQVTLAVYDKFIVANDLTREPPADALGATVLDSITLPAPDWASLAPPKPEAGSTWTVPEATVRKLYPLLSVSDTVFRDTKEVTAARLVGRVQRVANGLAYLAYEGQLAGTHLGTANEGKAGNKCSAQAQLLGGASVYDVKTQKMLSLVLVYDGQWRSWKPYDNSPTRFGAVVEWRAAAPSP